MAARAVSSDSNLPGHLPPPRFRTTFEKAIPTKNAAETTSFPPLSAENKYYTILDEDPAPTMTRGGADTAERQHLHASGRVSFLQILILPTPDRNDISFLSNKHQRWAIKCRYPMRYTVGAPSRTAPATEGEEVEPAWCSQGCGTRALERETLNAAT